MPYASYMQLKGADGANIFELKGWRWEEGLDRELKVHPTKSFLSTEPNPSIGLDFGSFTIHFALQGRLNSQRELNRLKTLAALTWYETATDNKMVTLKIGTGGTAITKNGVVENVHSEWISKGNYFIVTIKFWETLYFIV